MDLELWMQEDGTGIFGAICYACDIYDLGSIENMKTHLLVSRTVD